jgi:hypothetical protein
MSYSIASTPAFSKYSEQSRLGRLSTSMMQTVLVNGARVIVFLVISTLVCSVNVRAQRIIYNQGQDKTAQDAAAAAKDVSSGALFEKMLHNVDLQAKSEIDTAMAFVEQQMRAKIQNFTYWTNSADRLVQVIKLPEGAAFIDQSCKSVVCELRSLELKLNAFLDNSPEMSADQIKARLVELEKKKNALDQALKQLQSAAKSDDPAVVRAFSLLNDNGKDAVDYAKKISTLLDNEGHPVKGLSSALSTIGDGLDQVLTIYNAVKSIWDGYQAINVDPASLRLPQEQIDLQLLALEQDHLNTIAEIRAREIIEIGSTLNRVQTALNRLNAAGVLTSTARVENTLLEYAVNHDRQKLRSLLDALHDAVASVAEEDAAGRLAELRLSDEDRRYSIRRSAINSRTYDQTILAASQRLALYWKSGIKPSELAQLVFYIANTAGVSAIAVK